MVQAFAAELGVPALGEGMREYLERTGTDLHQLGHDGLRDVMCRLWAERQEQEARYNSFVADRASYDFAAFWLYYHFTVSESDTDLWFRETLAPGRYDHLFILPWGTIPLVADGVRSTNPYVQLHLQLLVEGLLRRHADVPPVALRATTLASRLAELRLRVGGAVPTMDAPEALP